MVIHLCPFHCYIIIQSLEKLTNVNQRYNSRRLLAQLPIYYRSFLAPTFLSFQHSLLYDSRQRWVRSLNNHWTSTSELPSRTVRCEVKEQRDTRRMPDLVSSTRNGVHTTLLIGTTRVEAHRDDTCCRNGASRRRDAPDVTEYARRAHFSMRTYSRSFSYPSLLSHTLFSVASSFF